jgi:hypothetical protein
MREPQSSLIGHHRSTIIPAKAGIQSGNESQRLDPRLRGDDGGDSFEFSSNFVARRAIRSRRTKASECTAAWWGATAKRSPRASRRAKPGPSPQSGNPAETTATWHRPQRPPVTPAKAGAQSPVRKPCGNHSYLPSAPPPNGHPGEGRGPVPSPENAAKTHKSWLRRPIPRNSFQVLNLWQAATISAFLDQPSSLRQRLWVVEEPSPVKRDVGEM